MNGKLRFIAACLFMTIGLPLVLGVITAAWIFGDLAEMKRDFRGFYVRTWKKNA